jgi:hypothetical protein
MRAIRWIGLALLVIVAGVVVLTWHTERYYEPAFGSTPKLSTIGGFALGKWKMDHDRTSAKSNDFAFLDSIGSATLALNENGTFRYSIFFDRVTGSWSADDRGVNLVIEAVDGIPPGQVRSDYEKYGHANGAQYVSRRQRAGYATRFMTLDLVESAKRLELYGNNKCLYQPGAYIHEDGSTFAGITIWRRLR